MTTSGREEVGAAGSESGRLSSEARFRAIVESAPDATILVDDGRIVLANRQTEQVFGYTADELLGQAVELLLPERFRAAHVERRRRYVEAARPRPMSAGLELFGRRKDGSEFPVEISLSPLDGSSQVIAAVRDVSDRKAADAALREADGRFRAAFANAPIGMALVAPDGRFLQVNQALCAMTGRDGSDLLGSHLRDLCHPEDRLAQIGLGVPLCAERSDTRNSEHRFIRANGMPMWVTLSASLVDDGDGSRYYVAQIQDIDDRKQAEAACAYQSLHDPLTGLGNRLLLMDRLQHALELSSRSHGQVALLFVDLDRFKVVNNTHGHDVGDELLTLAATRIDAALRPGDSVARIGGDEFVVLCRGLGGPDAVHVVARRLQRELAAPFVVDDVELQVSASIGVAVADGTTDAERLLRDADSAMYRAKERGRARYEVFNEGLRAETDHLLWIESNLKRALELDQLSVVYQPIVELASGRVSGAEALLRWQHPQLGALQPDSFIRVAETSGLIVAIGAWVLHEACHSALSWQTSAAADVYVAVNMSARQMNRPDLAPMVLRVLAETGLPPSALRLEITESVVIDASASVVVDLRALADHGVVLGIDDFGTGYSSMTYLKRLPVSFLKIDRSFVAGLGQNREDTAIVEATVALARSLGLQVIAEGVERPEQAQRLLELGCELAQGFLLGRPRPGALMTASTGPGNAVPRAG